MDNQALTELFQKTVPSVDFASFRVMRIDSEVLALEKEDLSPYQKSLDQGVMVNVYQNGGAGYCATYDLSLRGLQEAWSIALEFAKLSAGHTVYPFAKDLHRLESGHYESLGEEPFSRLSLTEKLEPLKEVRSQFKTEKDLVYYRASLWHREISTLYLCSLGSRLTSRYALLFPNLSVTAFKNGESQKRTLGGYGYGAQKGFEYLRELKWQSQAPVLAEEARALLKSPFCPEEVTDVVLAPDQMILQIHESIGHPLELDRILGDERNYAGTSFVTKEMFGNYQYGSTLLNVDFDPFVKGEVASYAYDDEGMKAEKVPLIEKGQLLQGIGGSLAMARLGTKGCANSRAVSWNRPPIDRMANLNLRAGNEGLSELISKVDRGIYMKTNQSWSIDDSRNKFQFGCEWGQRIENGKLTHLVRTPNYRGVSATFWRNLVGVGDESTLDVLGTPFCGKGEPNQAIAVGHRSPACLFKEVEVFGGHQSAET